MDWTHLLTGLGGALLLGLAHYIRTGRPPLLDPQNRYPRFDQVRDLVRKEIADHFAEPPRQ